MRTDCFFRPLCQAYSWPFDTSPVWPLNIAAITNGDPYGAAVIKLVITHRVGAFIL